MSLLLTMCLLLNIILFVFLYKYISLFLKMKLIKIWYDILVIIISWRRKVLYKTISDKFGLSLSNILTAEEVGIYFTVIRILLPVERQTNGIRILDPIEAFTKNYIRDSWRTEHTIEPQVEVCRELRSYRYLINGMTMKDIQNETAYGLVFIINELYKNSVVRASASSIKIKMDLLKSTNHLQLLFMDNGTGFDERNLEQAFHYGVGVNGQGLALINNTIKKLSGKVEIYSKKNSAFNN
jgi:DNA integrity scanning protein DisA with diadenylate cyclase activity